MKTKIILLIGIFLTMCFLMSCEKDYENVVDPVEEITSIGEFAPDSDVFFYDDSEEIVLKSMLNTINSATSYNDIPTYAYRCHQNYKYAYRHVKQPDNQSCSWTSYVICAGNVANAYLRNYPVTVNKVYAVKAGCNDSKLITALRNYANTADKNYVRADVFSLKKSSSTYLDVIKQMLTLLYQNKTPFVTIAKSGSVGHYLTVYSIHWKMGLTGSVVYFTDSLDPDRGSFDANVKSMDLGQFLYLMRTNSNTYYNFLRILP